MSGQSIFADLLQQNKPAWFFHSGGVFAGDQQGVSLNRHVGQSGLSHLIASSHYVALANDVPCAERKQLLENKAAEICDCFYMCCKTCANITNQSQEMKSRQRVVC